MALGACPEEQGGALQVLPRGAGAMWSPGLGSRATHSQAHMTGQSTVPASQHRLLFGQVRSQSSQQPNVGAVTPASSLFLFVGTCTLFR